MREIKALIKECLQDLELSHYWYVLALQVSTRSNSAHKKMCWNTISMFIPKTKHPILHRMPTCFFRTARRDLLVGQVFQRRHHYLHVYQYYISYIVSDNISNFRIPPKFKQLSFLAQASMDMDNSETQIVDEVLDAEVESLPATELDSLEYELIPDHMHPDNQLGLENCEDEDDEKYQQKVSPHLQEFIELGPGEYEDFIELWNAEHGEHSQEKTELEPKPPAHSNTKFEKKEAVPKKIGDEDIALVESDEEKVTKAGVHQDTGVSDGKLASNQKLLVLIAIAFQKNDIYIYILHGLISFLFVIIDVFSLPFLHWQDRKPLCKLPEIPASLAIDVAEQVLEIEKRSKNDEVQDLLQAFATNNKYANNHSSVFCALVLLKHFYKVYI